MARTPVTLEVSVGYRYGAHNASIGGYRGSSTSDARTAVERAAYKALREMCGEWELGGLREAVRQGERTLWQVTAVPVGE